VSVVATAADVVAAKPTKVLTPSIASPHALSDAMMRTTFVEASPTPESCSVHASVSVQSVAPVDGPDT
jgi:hypothetical protein